MVSIIVPIYNTQRYLPICIESILCQSYKELDIILVNDGSVDDSLNICDHYAKMDSRVTVLNQSNKGIIAAKQNGIQHAKGEYTMFVDSDDWIEPQMVELLLLEIKKSDVSAVFSNVSMDLEDGIVEKRNAFEEGVYNSRDIWKDVFYYKNTEQYGVLPYSVAKLFETGILKGVLNRIPTDIRYAEDKAILFTIIYDDCKISFINVMLYHYCIRNDSVSKIENQDYLIEITNFYKYVKQIFEKHVEKELLFSQLSKYLLFETKNAVDNKLGLKNNQGSIHKSSFRLDPSFYFEGMKKVVLYGAGKVGKDYYLELPKFYQMELVVWVDKNYQQYQNMGQEIFPVETVLEVEFDFVLVAVYSPEVFEEIRKELIDMGIDYEKIKWGKGYKYIEL